MTWHKAHRCRRMVQSYSPGGGNVSSHKSTLVPPGQYDWTCASFGPLESTTQTANRSVQPFCAAHGRKSPYFTAGAPIPQNCPFLRGSGLPSNTRFLVPIPAHNPHGTSIGSSVFARAKTHKAFEVPFGLYFTTVCPFPPQTYPFVSIGGSGPLENCNSKQCEVYNDNWVHIVRA